MATFESTVTIARPVEDVFRFFFEFDKNAGSLGIDSVVKEPEGPTGVGTTFHLREGSRGGEAITRFTSIDPNIEDWIRREGRSPQADRRIYLLVGRRRYETDGSS